jgi:glycosyltransferase involved in cell wall biosynthesis
LRGAERTFAAMSEVWPDAPIFTLLYDEDGTQQRFAERKITISPLRHFGVRQENFRWLLPLFPTAARRLDLEGFDCILSSSSAFAHGVRKPEGAVHVSYCYTPFRYAWHDRSMALSSVARPLRPVLDIFLRRHRAFDRRAVRDVDQFVADGRLTRERIQRFWGVDAPVVHPPVDIDRFSLAEPSDYVLFVGELVRHKRAELAIEAATAAGRPIKVVGSGPELERLKHRYARRAEFLGRVEDDELARLYAEAAALVVPNIEEFGIAAVEAQAAGRPVVAIDAGGVQETVVSGRTGLLVPDGGPGPLTSALRGDLTRFDPRDIREHAQQFRREVFQARIREIVDESYERVSRRA